MPHSSSPEGSRFTSGQPMRSGGNLLGGAGKEGLGQVLGERGGYGGGFGVAIKNEARGGLH